MATHAGADVSHRSSVLAILASTEALEAELQELRALAAEKDREIESLKRARRAPPFAPLSGMFAKLWGARSGSLRVPIVGRLTRVGEAAADACLRRASPWASCEEFAERFGGLLKYVDEKVIFPQVSAMRTSSRALTSPLLRVLEPRLRLPRELAAAWTQRAISHALWAQAKLQSWCGRPWPRQEALEGPDGWGDDAPAMPASTSSLATTATSDSFLAAAAATRRKERAD